MIINKIYIKMDEQKGGGMDDLLKSLGEDVTANAAETEEAKNQEKLEKEKKNKEAMEAIVGKVAEYQTLKYAITNSAGFRVGRMNYAVLKDDHDAFDKFDKEHFDDELKLADMYDDVVKTYQAAGGTEDVERIIRGQSREALESNVHKNDFDRFKKFLENPRSLSSATSDIVAKNPNEYVDGMEKSAVKQYQMYHDPVQYVQDRPDVLQNNLKNDFWGLTEGFGVAALEGGDIKLAARSLALGEVIGKLSTDVVEKAKVLAGKLNTEDKRLFAEEFSKEKERLGKILSWENKK
ncbi:MAG: hypothetical protein V4469_00195 [Patescibacteria group bacterium]